MSGGLAGWIILAATTILGSRGLWVVARVAVVARMRVLVEREHRKSLEIALNGRRFGSCLMESHSDGYSRLVYLPAEPPDQREESGSEVVADE